MPNAPASPTVLEQLTDGVLIADAQGIVQFANPAAGRLFQTSQPINLSITEVVRHHQLVEAWRRCQQTRQMQSETVEVPTRHQYLQLVVVPDQHASGSLLLAQDLTRIRRLETVRRDFISNLSHELRTPLASLKALTETLQDGALDDPPAARRFIDQIQIETDALTQMVTELLELSRIESGRLILDLRPVSPSDLLSSASQRMQLQAERAGMTLRDALLRLDILPETVLPTRQGELITDDVIVQDGDVIRLIAVISGFKK